MVERNGRRGGEREEEKGKRCIGQRGRRGEEEQKRRGRCEEGGKEGEKGGDKRGGKRGGGNVKEGTEKGES